jgi:alpha-amylase/alpha-mannosidase (GH57 family)
MAEKYICIHGHFYQPPRENAWLEAVEIQDSAYPYHDWNQRITEECYSANAYSRILDKEEKITSIVNNYEKMSFNFGPTLLSWMEENTPDIYEAIIEADSKSMNHFSGHGSAMAQVYNHMIMPLANSHDKYTQVFWGIRDFQHRFGRKPEGMWLSETAVDFETLEIMAGLGIVFTVLTPYQAARVRKIGEKKWHDVSEGIINPRMPYTQKLRNGKKIAVYFYDGPISQAVAFESLLKNGEEFANRLVEGFVNRDEAQLVHIATDGESYGHHSPFGDMALAYAIKYIEDKDLATLTNYGEYLEKHPPAYEVEIFENTSWSCSHGLERWRDNCGCGAADGYHHQQWRRPLREALDYLRDKAADAYEKELGRFFRDPWKARNDYINIVQDRSPENLEIFIQKHAKESSGPPDSSRILKLLEMQRHAMLMYTSCGWFFNDLSRIETVQIIQYAGRLLQLCAEMFDQDFESPFLEKLAKAKSNRPSYGDGKQIYKHRIKPAIVDLRGVASHYAISSLFEDFSDQSPLFCYDIRCLSHNVAEAGIAKLGSGCVEITSKITRESAVLQFAVLYVGDHNLSCGVCENGDDKKFEKFMQILSDQFDRAEFTEIFRILNNYFKNSIYSLNSLFRDGQRKIINLVLEGKVKDALAVYNRLYRQNIPLMRFLKGSSTPCPPALYSAGTLALNKELKEQFNQDALDHDKIAELLKEAELAGISLEADTLEYTLRKNIEAKAKQFEQNPVCRKLLNRINNSIDLASELPFSVNLRKVQNIFYAAAIRKFSNECLKKQLDHESADGLIKIFETICEKLNIRIFHASPL